MKSTFILMVAPSRFAHNCDNHTELDERAMPRQDGTNVYLGGLSQFVPNGDDRTFETDVM
jgi:hypothetical protein